ncbi:MAG: Gfo/Idh/MocA family oxidoreductase [Bacteroidetes bacterium]|nr:MAG: Gfo/Idh/MocA family oxidoreductase [Bacteroidota bacterium]
MKNTDTIKWGIIGVGKVTEVKSGPAFYKNEHSELVAVMRRDAEKAADYAKRHNIQKWYANASELINDPEVDTVYIATPPDSHARYVIQAMKAGKPVYVEKPMARTYAECQEMLRVSEETGMPLFVAYYRRTLPAFLKVREMIWDGTIGKPLMINVKLFKPAGERGKTPEQMSWHVFPEISGAGHFYDLASHQFDYLDFIFGAVTDVNGTAANLAGLYPAEDTVTATWRHESGVVGCGSWCFVVDKSQFTDEIEIIGDAGKIIIPTFTHGKVRIFNKNGLTELDFINPENIQFNLVKQVVGELRGVEKCVSTGISAARTSWVLEEIVKEYYENKPQ